jgi:hypothetical protein
MSVAMAFSDSRVLSLLNRMCIRSVLMGDGGGPGVLTEIREELRVDGRLMADLGRIRQVSGRLGWVEREFSDASQFTGGDGTSLGAADLESALQACVTGWGQQRTALIGQLSSVARLSGLAASSYEQTDAQLTAVLARAMSAGTGG